MIPNGPAAVMALPLGNVSRCNNQRAYSSARRSTLAPPGDLVLHNSIAWQRVIGLQIIVVHTSAREVIPQPTPQPSLSNGDKAMPTDTRQRAVPDANLLRWSRVSPIVFRSHDFFLSNEQVRQCTHVGSCLHRATVRHSRPGHLGPCSFCYASGDFPSSVH